MKRNQACEERAEKAARAFRQAVSGYEADTAIILGTGWGGALTIEEDTYLPLSLIPGFEEVGELEGHARMLHSGHVAGKWIFVLDGRIHMNEAPVSPADAVRLQVEMLFHLGVTRLILTCAAGSLNPKLEIGDIMILDGFITTGGAPIAPLYAGEFCSPERALDVTMAQLAHQEQGSCSSRFGGYAARRGPEFEGSKYDKDALRQMGASAVGMSMYPEACVAALYDVKTLGLCFITNDAYEKHSHEENQRRAKAKSVELGAYLERIVRGLP